MNVRIATPKSAAEATLMEQFAALRPADPDRTAAFQAFVATGLPTRRNEAWHYTDLRSLMSAAAPLAPAPDAGRIEAARGLLAARERVGTSALFCSTAALSRNCPTMPPKAFSPGCLRGPRRWRSQTLSSP